MTLEEQNVDSWTFMSSSHLDAPQKAKKKVADENSDVNYKDLRARVMRDGGAYMNSLVTVVKIR